MPAKDIEPFKFKKGKPKTGGRQKGARNRLKPDDIMNIVDLCLQDDMTFTDINGNAKTQAGILWMIKGWMKNVAKKGDARGIELLLRIYGLLQDNVNLTGDVQLTANISTDQVFKELGTLVKSVRDRKATEADKPSKV